MPQVGVEDLAAAPSGEPSATIGARVAAARAVQRARFEGIDGVAVNADAEGELLDAIVAPSEEARRLVNDIAARFRLSARAYHRVLRVARTIADLEASAPVERRHIAEAAGYRLAL